MSWASGLAASVRFLTVLPVPSAGRSDDGLRWAAAFFPVVGLGLGGALWLAMSLPWPALPRAAVVLSLWVVLTGGLHEDGWADCMDAAWAPVPRERRLDILKDPRVGAHGLTGTVLLMLLRFSALAVVAPAVVVIAPVVGRWTMAMSLAMARPARTEGLAARFALHPRPWSATLLAMVIVAATAVSTGSGRWWWMWLLAAGVAAWVAAFLHRRFGGLTGDGHGAVGLAAETAVLFAAIVV